MNTITEQVEIGGKPLILEYGRFAEQAGSAIVARHGDTMVLVTVVAAPPKQEVDYFPLFVEYIERLYAGGKIKGSRWVKREGRPSDDDILAARLIDRSIRPLFPKEYKKEVQVIATVLSVDLENSPEILSTIAASAAVATSNIPWKGPVGTVRVGLKEGTFFINPTLSELKFSELDLVVTANEKAVFMLEAGASQVPEEEILKAVEFGQGEAGKISQAIEKLVEKVGKEKEILDEPDDGELISFIDKKFGLQIDSFTRGNAAKEVASPDELKNVITEAVSEKEKGKVGQALGKVIAKRMRDLILSGKRLDGRKHNQIREISAETGILPRTHGSAVFKRGQTQVLSATTLGPPGLEQTIESAEGEETKRYMHHYSFPPFSVGETGRVGSPSRREIGHGALAERALVPVIPTEDKFPYTIRVVSEVLSSNGSTSMASTCGSTMSLMDAGVPILAPVSGIAMGLVLEPSTGSGQAAQVAILSDIMGVEDGSGDMDFKVAGSKKGVTAIQLDVKTPNLTLEILSQALFQAREGRLFILEKMLEVMPESRTSLSKYAPKVAVVQVAKEKIGGVIGSGGSTIRKIMAATETRVDIDDDGVVTISGMSVAAVDKAKTWVEGIVKEAQPGEIYEGEVKRIQPFGAFVEILPGKDGLVHISDMSQEYVKDPQDIVKIGDKVKVKVKEVDNLGRVNLTMLLDGERKEETRSLPRAPQRPKTSQAPHFPASRFIPSKKRF